MNVGNKLIFYFSDNSKIEVYIDGIKDYSVSYTYPNLVSLSLLGGGNIYYPNKTLREGLSIIPSSVIEGNDFFNVDVNVDLVSKGLFRFYSEKNIDKSCLFKYNYSREQCEKLYLHIQNIPNMRLKIRNNSGNVLYIDSFDNIGVYKDKNNTIEVAVKLITEDFIYLSMQSIRKDQGTLFVAIENIEYNECYIKYPTVIEDSKIDIDPNNYYECEAEINNSHWIGKNLMVFGDSQQNEQYVTRELINRFGFNVYNSAQGGHAVGYRNNTKNWLYSWNYDLMDVGGFCREYVFKLKNIDLYLMLISTNDNASDNDNIDIVVDETGIYNKSIEDIKKYYPWFNDDNSTVSRKLSEFQTLSEQQKKQIFSFQQTYAAYIKQLLEFNPLSQFVLSTIPICPSMYYQDDGNGGVEIKDGYTIEEARYNDYRMREKNKRIQEIADYFNLPIADGARYVNMTYENYHMFVHSTDFVHWTNQNNLIKKRWAQCISGVIEDLYIE